MGLTAAVGVSIDSGTKGEPVASPDNTSDLSFFALNPFFSIQ